MNKKNILIVGDSFSADWSAKSQDYPGWPSLLSAVNFVTNLSQAGCSEYKIWKQLESAKLSKFDVVLISHTSPFRLPVERHPKHINDIFHKNCDLIYSDIKDCEELSCVTEYFEKYFDLEYAKFVHQLIVNHEIDYVTKNFSGKIIRITNLDSSHLVNSDEILNFESIFQKQRGLVNHFNQQGNQIIFESISRCL